MIAKSTRELLMKEYLKRVLNELETNSELDAISPGIGKLLADHTKSIVIMEKVCKTLEAELNEHLDDFKRRLERAHPYKSRIGRWLHEKINEERVNE